MKSLVAYLLIFTLPAVCMASGGKMPVEERNFMFNWFSMNAPFVLPKGPIKSMERSTKVEISRYSFDCEGRIIKQEAISPRYGPIIQNEIRFDSEHSASVTDTMLSTKPTTRLVLEGNVLSRYSGTLEEPKLLRKLSRIGPWHYQTYDVDADGVASPSSTFRYDPAGRKLAGAGEKTYFVWLSDSKLEITRTGGLLFPEQTFIDHSEFQNADAFGNHRVLKKTYGVGKVDNVVEVPFTYTYCR